MTRQRNFERANIAAMDGYVSGEQPRDSSAIKLNTNENPYAPAPGVQAVIGSFSADHLRRYPQPTANGFRDCAAALHQVERDNIIATRGGDELLRLLITTFVEPGEPIGMTDPTYSLYPVLAAVQDCPCVYDPLNPDWSVQDGFADRINAAGCKLTFVVNPHAPSGRMMNVQELDALASSLDGLLVIDEAYVDFADDQYDAIPLIHHHDNVVILRTLSKGYSLAGLRFGYGIGPQSLILPMLNKTRDSYNLDALSQEIATAALSDQAYAQGTWQKVVAERQRLRQQLADLGMKSPPSQTNFLLVDEPATVDAATVYSTLKDNNILVRYFDTPVLRDKLRITVGTPAENNALLGTLKELIATRGSDTP